MESSLKYSLGQPISWYHLGGIVSHFNKVTVLLLLSILTSNACSKGSSSDARDIGGAQGSEASANRKDIQFNYLVRSGASDLEKLSRSAIDATKDEVNIQAFFVAPIKIGNNFDNNQYCWYFNDERPEFSTLKTMTAPLAIFLGSQLSKGIAVARVAIRYWILNPLDSGLSIQARSRSELPAILDQAMEINRKEKRIQVHPDLWEDLKLAVRWSNGVAQFVSETCPEAKNYRGVVK